MHSESDDNEPSDSAEVFASYLLYKDDVKYLESKSLQERQAAIEHLMWEHATDPETGEKLKAAKTHHLYMIEVAKASRDGLKIIEKNHPEISGLAEKFEREWEARWEAERSAAATGYTTEKELKQSGTSTDQAAGERDPDDHWRTWSDVESTAWIRNHVGRSMSEDGTGSHTMLDQFANQCTVS